MKYYSESGEVFAVESVGVSDKGTHYAVVTIAPDEDTSRIIASIPSSHFKTEIEAKLAEYAKENDLTPELIWKLKKGDRILQGVPKVFNDFIAVDESVKAKEFDNYLAAKSRISVLESEKKSEIEDVKKIYADKIEVEEEIMESIESIVKTGTRKEECSASWERDIENGAMLLIRHDNLKVLQWRKMDEQELQMTIDDQDGQSDE
jgi:predicted secreted protein